jgi:hypothetical protein
MPNKNFDYELQQLEKEVKQPFSQYVVKSPTYSDTQKLIQHLQPELEGLAANEEIHVPSHQEPSLFKQCVKQFAMYQRSFWIISIVLGVMLALIGPIFVQPQHLDSNLTAILLPLYILVGIGYSYKTWNKEMRMVEMITPFPPALLLLSRLFIILVMNLVLGIINSIYLKSSVPDVSFFEFTLSWLAPSVFLFGFLALVLFYKGVKVGSITTIIVWIGISFQPVIINDFFVMNFGFSSNAIAEVMPLVHLVNIGLGAVALYVAYRKSLSLYEVKA